jgi:CubicO group peptidase (beta-lactamase class C family)
LTRLAAALAALLLGAGAAFAGADPVFSDTGPDAEAYGKSSGYPVGGRLATQGNLVGLYSHFADAFPTRRVDRADTPTLWRRAQDELALTYRYAGADRSLADYLDRHPATGLLVAHGDEILYEHYRYARTDHDLFQSASMAKTITSMLFGIALSEGKIHSIDDPAAAYIPELVDNEYGKTPLRALLHMSSGNTFTEVYDGHDDNARLGRALFGVDSKGPAQSVGLFGTRENPPDTHFHYASIETEVIGTALSNAVGMPLADYLRDRIWRRIGTEADANWALDGSGHEPGFCCFNATLRDWARLGLMLAQDGAWNGTQIVPRQWVIDATTADPAFPHLAPRTATPYYGYGYQVWLFPGARRQFGLFGIHGQVIVVDPAARLVLVHTAARVPARDPAAVELRALWEALVARFTS